MEIRRDATLATQLADSVCARLCHELASPLGTLMGALELAIEEPGSAAEALPLASEAATQMVMRLRLLRAAWGGDCGALDAAALAQLAAGLPPRVRTEMEGLTGQFPAPVARVLVNMLLLAVEALPRGGTVSLRGGPGDDVMLMASGMHAAWPPGLALALADPAAPVDDPRGVQAPLAAHLARAAGLRLSLAPIAAASSQTVAPLLLGAA